MRHIRKILVPIDGSPASLAGLAQAALLAEDVGGRLDVLHVIAPETSEVASARSLTRPEKEQAERDMAAAIDNAETVLGDRLRRLRVPGDPVREILAMASEHQPDLIVMGTHGRVGRIHSLVGSVAEAVVRNAPCPVLTVRRGEEESFADKVHHRSSIFDQARSSR